MLRKFEHVGMTVSDMDRALGFYVGLLGLTLVVRRPAPGGEEIAFLSAGEAMLEIVAVPGALAAADVPAGRAGLRHLTFDVASVDATWARLQAAGVALVEPPRPARNRDMLARVAFCRDPDGILVELAEH